LGHAVSLVPWGDFDGNGTSEISWHWGHFYPIAEAMLALVLIDHALRHRAQNADVAVDTPDIAKQRG